MIALQKYLTAADVPYHIILALALISLFIAGVTFIYIGSQKRLTSHENNSAIWASGVVFIVLAIISAGFLIFAHIPK